MDWDDSDPPVALRVRLRALLARLLGMPRDRSGTDRRQQPDRRETPPKQLSHGNVLNPRVTRHRFDQVAGSHYLGKEIGVRVRAQNAAAASEVIASNRGLTPRHEVSA